MAAMTRALLLLLLFVLAIWSAEGQQRVYDVLDFHAAGDGKTDDAQVAAAQPHEFLILQVPAFAWL
jgi:polygalacturonase